MRKWKRRERREERGKGSDVWRERERGERHKLETGSFLAITKLL